MSDTNWPKVKRSRSGAALAQRFSVRLLCVVLVALLCSACRPVAPTVDTPVIDSGAAAAAAMELLDANGDQQLDDDELSKAPGLADGKQRADANGDGLLDEDEIADRIASWRDSYRSLIATPLSFSRRNRPVRNAQVTLQPEPFLEEWLTAVSGETDGDGSFTPAISREVPGMYLGYYRIQISAGSGGRQSSAASKKPLGVELCADRPIGDDFQFHFKVD